jgi:hypothetical protein
MLPANVQPCNFAGVIQHKSEIGSKLSPGIGVELSLDREAVIADAIDREKPFVSQGIV